VKVVYCLGEAGNFYHLNWWDRTIKAGHSIPLDCPFNCYYVLGYIMTYFQQRTVNHRLSELMVGEGGRLG